VTCYPHFSSSSLKFCAGNVVTGGLLGLAVFILGTITAVAGYLIGGCIDDYRRSQVEKMLKDLSDTCKEMHAKIADIRSDMQKFDASYANQEALVDDACVCTEYFLERVHSWEQFQKYLDEEIEALRSLQKIPNVPHAPESLGSDLIMTVASGALAGAAAGAALADTMGMRSSLAIGGAAAVGGAVGGAAAAASVARPALKTMAVEEPAP
jgi:hypothetical protein